MATRKAAAGRRRTTAATRTGAGRSTPTARKAAGSRKGAARKKAAGPRKATRRSATGRKSGPRTRLAAVRKRASAATRKRPAAVARKRASAGARKRSAAKPRTRPASSQAKALAGRARQPSKALPRKSPPARGRRRPTDEDAVVQSVPSSLDLNRSASSARSGRRGLRDRYDEHREAGPIITAGDVDADWESAYSVGDEVPGGDNPTPDQDVVDEIGRAVGVEYQDNEELKGDEKIAKRDRHRWELDPASAEDYDER